MTTPKAIFFGLALIAAAIFARDIVTPADAGIMDDGKFMGVAASTTSIWIVDTETGKAMRCATPTGSTKKPAKCYGWSE